MRTGPALIQATRPFEADDAPGSWWWILSTGCLLSVALAGALWNFHPPVARVVCSVLAGLLVLRFFVIYHDQQHHAILPNPGWRKA